ncbi:MAG: zf-HC2 domain-containing protein, partial [Lachnospiraceae bacterium]
MSIKNECAIVRDLLPLYAEKMVCGETAEFVRDHLEGCASCRAELEQIGSGQSDEKEKNDEIPAENDTAPLARIGKTVFKRKMYAVLMTALILSAFLVSVFGYLSSPEYLPYSPDTVSVGETADGALAVSFGENVTGYRIYEEASPDGENASVYRIEAWTSLLDRMFLHPGRQNAVIRPDDAGRTAIWFAQNGTNKNLSDDVQIYGKTENGGRISLPRLFLWYYLIAAAAVLIILLSAAAAVRKDRRLCARILKIAALPASYI